MEKRMMHDIRPPEGRSIKSIPLPERRRVHREVPDDAPVRRETPRPVAKEEPRARESYPSLERRKSGFRWKLWITAIVLIVVGAYSASYFFSGAKLVVTPKQQKVSVDSTLSAHKFSEDGTSSGLAYELAVTTKEGSKEIPTTKEAQVETKATGQIVIYNNYNAAPQTLVTNTRFESTQGKIYRINKEVVVPGKKVVGGETVPGSIEVTVYADKAGEEYNVGMLDFTIPGFKGDPRYATFYARSKTPMAGGFVGKRKVADSALVSSVRKTLDDELKAELIAESKAKIPEGFISFESGFEIEFVALPDVQTETGIEVHEKATISAYVFKKDELNKEIAIRSNIVTTEKPLRVSGTEALQFAVRPTATSTASTTVGSLTFKVKGDLTFIAEYDALKLAEDLAGTPRANVNNILASYPSIEKAKVVLKPFWKSSFPEEPAKITIEESLENE